MTHEKIESLTLRVKSFLQQHGVANVDNLVFALEEIEWEDVEEQLDNINGPDAHLLTNPNHTYETFNINTLPKEVKDLVDISVLASSGSFANSTALAIATFVLSDLFGQFRFKINDSVYSHNAIGLNIYAFVLSLSGKGKDLTYKVLTNQALAKAQEYIFDRKKEDLEKTARSQFIFKMQMEDKNFDKSTVTRADYAHLIEEVEDHSSDMNSTRGGYTYDVNRMERGEVGVRNIFSSEFAMTFKSNEEILKLMDTLFKQYDTGDVKKPSFKGVDSREAPIKEHYTNVLGISSPNMFLTDTVVKDKFYPLLKQGLGRRSYYISPTKKELRENRISGKTLAEKREVLALNRNKLINLLREVDETMFNNLKTVVSSPKVLMFDDEASQLYQTYFSLTKEKADLLELVLPNSLISLDMGGRAFKMGRIAGVWALAQGKTVIDKSTLEAAIYFADYAANHLIDFEQMLTMKNYEILVNDYLKGYITNSLSLDQAIIKGYITEKQTSAGAIKSFLEPINSKLRGKATVSYSTADNSFKFISTIKNVSVGDYSYTISPVLQESDRKLTPNRVKDNVQLSTVGFILDNDAIFNPFGSKDLTKWVVLRIEKSTLSAKTIDKFLSDYNRLISVTENEEIINIVLPLNEFITKKEYTYVVSSIATELMVKVLASPDETYQAYKNTTILGQFSTDLSFYDVSDIRAKYASKEPMPRLSTPKELTKAQKEKAATKAVELVEQAVEQIDNADNVLLTFAQVVRYMKTEYVSDIQILDSVDSINSLLTNPISQKDKEQYLIESFKEI